MSWSTPTTVREQVEKAWDSGRLLAARISGEAFFPLEIRLRHPKARDITERFGAVMDWVNRLQEQSRERCGHGYELRWQRVNNRVHGGNAIPVAAIIADEAQALRLIRRQQDAQRFQALADTLLQRHPPLRDWVQRQPLALLRHADDWPRLLAVLAWFLANPRPGLYLRQLDIPGVDTKFIEARRGLLSELLDAVLPASAVDHSATGVKGFARRYGLRTAPPQIRFRLLDPALAIQGMRDIAIPPQAFAGLRLPVRRVFITENRVNGLAFPDAPASLVIFGLGYGLERLAEIPWLHDTALWYWGDIDTHGFGILNRLRASLPHARSLLMDRVTLMEHQPLWGQEPEDKRYTGRPTRLTAAEQALFEALHHDRLGERVRLEQERIAFGAVERAVAATEDLRKEG
ncbi:hypothetical protein EQG41_17075 [Billgrantia azerbaijanica]|nr:hypothetical protein EQG41_17075 [Halomonas azerbaijanica]